MADTVSTKVISNGSSLYAVQFNCLSDGTGESAVVKVDISGLTGPNGVECTKTAIVGIFWNIGGFTSIRLYWDHTTDLTIAQMSGSSLLDYSGMGKNGDTGTGDTGDIVLTSSGAVSGASYTIVLILEKLE